MAAASVAAQIVPRMGYSADGVGNFAVLTLLTALGTGLYLQCIYADPGGAGGVEGRTGGFIDQQLPSMACSNPMAMHFPVAAWVCCTVSVLVRRAARTSAFVAIALHCCAPAGRVPPGWQPDTEKQQAVQVKRRGGGARYCKKCAAYKPPRTHHCRRCGHCVLRMDHHCVSGTA